MKNLKNWFGFKRVVFACAAFLLSCSDNALTPEQIAQIEQTVAWVFSGTVYDYFGAYDATGRAELGGVVVSTSNGGQRISATTDSLGFFSINGLSAGSHSFRFEKAGYETIHNYSPDNGQNQQIGTFYDVENAQIAMYRNDASISGKVYLVSPDNSSRTTVAGVPVRIDVGSSFLPRYRYAQTDAQGDFSMTGLPRVSVIVEFEHFISGAIRYAYQNSNGNELSRTVDLSRASSAGTFDLIPVFTDIVQMLSNNFAAGTFAGDTLTASFDQDLDPASLEVSVGSISLTWSLSSDGRTLTAVPQTRLTAETTYSFLVSGKTAEGANFSWQAYFTTADGPMLLSSNLLDTNGQIRDNVLSTETIVLTFDREISSVLPYDNLRGKVNVVLDSNEVQIIPIEPFSNSTRNTLVGNLSLVTTDGFLALIDLPNFTLKGSVFVVSSNVLDKELSGLRDVPIHIVVEVVLSDSVASVTEVSGSYPDYRMTLDSTGTRVTVLRTSSYSAGGGYNFSIYGLTVDGQQFSLFIPTFYIEDFANINIVGGNIFDQNLNGLQNLPSNIAVEVELSEAVESVISSHPSYPQWQFTLDSTGTRVQVSYLQNFLPGTSYSFRIYGSTLDSFNFQTNTVSSFRIADNPQVYLLSSSALDQNMNGLQSLPQNTVITAVLSDSVASVIGNHPSYPDYEMTLGADGRTVTITRLSPYNLGSNYNFVIYGVTASGENFSVSHPTFRIEEIPSIFITGGNALDANLNGLVDLPKDIVVTVDLSDSVASVVQNHPSYTNYNMALSANGRRVTVTANNPYDFGGSYNFALYGTTVQGQNFSLSHPTFRIQTSPSIYIVSSNALDANLDGLQDLPKDIIVTVTLSDSVASVVQDHPSYQDYSMTLSADGREVTVTRNVPYNYGGNYSFAIYGLKANGQNFSISHSSFRIEASPNIRIVSSNALDTNLNGLQDVPKDIVITVVLSDSVASVVQTHASYQDYNMLLSADGREVTVTRNAPYSYGGSYNFTIYGLKSDGQNFNVSHTTFRIVASPSIRIVGSNALDTNLNGLQDVPRDIVVTLTLSDSVASIIQNHPSYLDYNMVLGANGRQVTVTRNVPYNYGGNYSFTVYGVKVDGQNFSVSHSSFRIVASPSIRIVGSNALDTNLNGLQDMPRDIIVTVQLSDSVASVVEDHPSYQDYHMVLSANGRQVTVTRNVPYNFGGNYSFAIYGLKADGQNFNVSHSSFRIESSPNIRIVSSNAMDINLNGLQDVPRGIVITVQLSDSVASVVEDHPSYQDYHMVLSANGRQVTVTRNVPYNFGGNYSFAIYGVKVDGQNFNVSHSTFRIEASPDIRILGSNALDSNLSGLYDLPLNLVITVDLSDSVASVVRNHPSYAAYNMALGANGRQVTVTRNTPYQAGSNYNFAIYGVKTNGENFNVSHGTYYIMDTPNVTLVSSNALDANLNGLYDLPRDLVITLELSDSVASVVQNHPNYTEYDMVLAADGRHVTVTRRTPYSLGSGYNFYVYGTTQSGENFSVNHTTFYIQTQPVFIDSSTALGPDGTGLRGLPANMDIMVYLSDSIHSVTNTNASWDMGLSSSGRVVTVRRLTNYSSSENSFTIPIIDATGTSFNLSHPSFYINTSAQIAWTNIRDMNGNGVTDFPLGDTLLFVFSEKIDFSQGYNVYWNNYSSGFVTDTSASGDTLKVITLQSLNPDIQEGIYLENLTTTEGYIFDEGWLYFNTENNRVLPGAVQGFGFDTTGNYFTYLPMTGSVPNVPVTWDEMDSVDHYLVQAVGTVAGNAGWVTIEQVNSNFSGGALFAGASISNSDLANFQPNPNLPLSGNNQISLRVLAVNSAGQGVPSNVLALSDDVSVGQDIGGTRNPLSSVGYSGGTWNNATGAAYDVYIDITFPEWMNIATSPTIAYTEAGGDVAAVATVGATTWEWLSTTTGRFVITVPAGTDWSGDAVTISIEGVQDDSGNPSENNAYTTDAGSGWLGATP